MSRAAQQPRAPKRRISQVTEPSKPSGPEAYPTLVDPRDRISEPVQLELARDVLDFMADHLPLASVSGTVPTEHASQLIQPIEPVEPAVRSTEIDQLLHSPQSPQSSPLLQQTQPGLCPASPASLPEQAARPAKKLKRPKSDPILATNLLISDPTAEGQKYFVNMRTMQPVDNDRLMEAGIVGTWQPVTDLDGRVMEDAYGFQVNPDSYLKMTELMEKLYPICFPDKELPKRFNKVTEAARKACNKLTNIDRARHVVYGFCLHASNTSDQIRFSTL